MHAPQYGDFNCDVQKMTTDSQAESQRFVPTSGLNVKHVDPRQNASVACAGYGREVPRSSESIWDVCARND